MHGPFRPGQEEDQEAPQTRLDVWSTESTMPAGCEPRGVTIRPDGITAVLPFGAAMEGDLQPPPQPCAGPRDRISWTVDVPQEGEYQAALLYNGASEILRGNRFELSASPSNAVIRGELQERWWSPARPWVARHRLHLRLILKRGQNSLSFHLTDVSEAQVRLARGPRSPARGAQNRDFRLWSVELARPGALASIAERARSLRPSNDWMIAGKYGLFTHFSPLTYPFHGGKMAYTNWQWGVDVFDVAAYADAVEKTGAKWVIFTTSHGMVSWPGPNRTIDRLIRGRTCRRDLLQELARELSKRGIRLCLYFHFGSSDHRWHEAVGMNDPSHARRRRTSPLCLKRPAAGTAAILGASLISTTASFARINTILPGRSGFARSKREIQERWWGSARAAVRTLRRSTICK